MLQHETSRLQEREHQQPKIIQKPDPSQNHCTIEQEGDNLKPHYLKVAFSYLQCKNARWGAKIIRSLTVKKVFNVPKVGQSWR